ncbi:MAG: hypothetical protein RLZZ292_792 [Bacteroidota bacterium]|jgi:hypothetical protein
MKKNLTLLLLLFAFCANAQTADAPSSYAFKKLHEQHIDTTKICFQKCIKADKYETRQEDIEIKEGEYEELKQKKTDSVFMLDKRFYKKKIYSVFIGGCQGFSEWYPCICNTALTPAITEKIKAALRKRGYDIPGSPHDNCWGTLYERAALLKFQKDNDLPICALTLETLKKLGFSFEELGLLIKQ